MKNSVYSEFITPLAIRLTKRSELPSSYQELFPRHQKSYLGSDGLFCRHIFLELVSKNKSAYARKSQADSRKAASKLLS
jgi:hypothetical protein